MNIFQKVKYVLNSFLKTLNGNANWQRINNSLSKGALSSSARSIVAENPLSWEFSAFSQNSEDGIISFLSDKIINPNKYFVEIGSSDGIENNTAYLALVKRFSGLMVEGNKLSSYNCRRIMDNNNLGVKSLNLFVTKKNINTLFSNLLHKDPDVFSLDIDSTDYYMMKSLIDNGLKPSIIVVEYNSTFGPSKKITVEYKDDFNIANEHPSSLYYGVSINGWNTYFKSIGYKFVTVDSNGVNAFFINPEKFNKNFVESIDGIKYKENFYEFSKFQKNHEERFELIKNMKYIKI
jgi:hypothetical protein